MQILCVNFFSFCVTNSMEHNFLEKLTVPVFKESYRYFIVFLTPFYTNHYCEPHEFLHHILSLYVVISTSKVYLESSVFEH